METTDIKMQRIKITKIRSNPQNPRVIKDWKFEKLVKSIKEFPEMLELRPIVVNNDYVILGGNMRYKACIDAGLKEVPILLADKLTPEQQKEFIIKDNVGFGEWNWEILANEWDELPLQEWGIDIPDYSDIDIDDFFEEDTNNDEDPTMHRIVLDYSEEDYNIVMDKLNNIKGSKESIIYELLVNK